MSPRRRHYLTHMRFFPGQERMLSRLCHQGAMARTRACAGITDTSTALEWLQELERFGLVRKFLGARKGQVYWYATEQGRKRTGVLRVGWDVMGR